jgi:dienelactone hydrolase
MTVCRVLALFLIFPAVAGAQPKPGDEKIDKYLAQETAKISQRFLDGATTLEQWQARLPRLRQEYLDMLGLWPLPEKTPLHVTVTGTLERDDFVVDKLHFQSRPGLYVTGNLYRPKQVTGKLPAILYVCGHSGRGRDGNKTAFQDHGMWFATNGYVCLVIDTLQLGEVPGIHHGTYSYGRWWWQARGYTPGGVECWNGIRAIDYLVSRPDVDADRIAVTGISGGGAATFWISAADERVRCAVPVSGMSDLESYVSHKVINGHCDCMFMVNTYGWEWTTIAALVAPRPLLFCNSDNDPIFPMDGNRRIIARLRKLYQMYGKPDLVDDYVSHGGHDYRPDLRVAIFKWINKHVKGDTGPVKDAEFKPFPGKELRVFLEDKNLPADVANSKIDESFVPGPDAKLPDKTRFDVWKRGLVSELRRHSFRALPERIPPAERSAPATEAGTVAGTLANHRLTTEPGIEVRTIGFAIVEAKEKKDGVVISVMEPEPGPSTLVVSDRERPGPVGGEDLRPYGRKGAVLYSRGLAAPWTKKSPPNYVERAHALLGRTVDEGRVWDVVATYRFLQARDGTKSHWRIAGRGRAAILVAYAALLEPDISEILLIDPPSSSRDGPIFLNASRVLDVPAVLGLLAPRRLTLVNAKDKAFDRTAAIYKLAGAEANFKR